MTEMIERVARAIAASEGYDVDGLKAYAASSSVAKSDYAKLQVKARAAIAAMRTPTEEMEFAGDNLSDSGAAVWDAMISAALKEPTR